jgi:hypothetical protein
MRKTKLKRITWVVVLIIIPLAIVLAALRAG